MILDLTFSVCKYNESSLNRDRLSLKKVDKQMEIAKRKTKSEE
jgi:hypothetical protein